MLEQMAQQLMAPKNFPIIENEKTRNNRNVNVETDSSRSHSSYNESSMSVSPNGTNQITIETMKEESSNSQIAEEKKGQILRKPESPIKGSPEAFRKLRTVKEINEEDSPLVRGNKPVKSPTLNFANLIKVTPVDSETDSSHSKSSPFNEEIKIESEQTEAPSPLSPPISKKMKLTWKSLREIQVERQKTEDEATALANAYQPENLPEINKTLTVADI